MKLVLSLMMFLSTLSANAISLEDILKAALNKQSSKNHSNPYEPGYPNYGMTCVANDRGYEEHSGGHYSCGECLSEHGDCIETCSARMSECQIEGRDRNGSRVGFIGRGDSRWSAEDDGMRRCYYRANNCRIVRCQERNDTVSRRSCK